MVYLSRRSCRGGVFDWVVDMSWRTGGVRPWVAQRVSAGYMAIFIVVAVIGLLLHPPTDYFTWKALLQQPLINTGFIIFCLCLFLHAWIGLRDVILDYVADDSLRFLTLILAIFYLAVMAIWILKVLLITVKP